MYDCEILYELPAEKEKLISLFLSSFAEFNYFQSPVFFHVCAGSSKNKPVYIIAHFEGKVVGVLLYYQQIQLQLPFLNFLTSRNIIIGGPVVSRKDVEISGILLKKYSQHSDRSIYTQVRNLYNTSEYYGEFKKYGFNYEDHLTIIIDLRKSLEVLWQEIHTKRRNEIRRAEKEGCTVSCQTSIEMLGASYIILKEVYKRARLPLPELTYFNALLKHSNEKVGLRLFTVMWQEKIIGCMICLAYGDTLYDYYAGAYSQYYNKYPNDLLPWEVFKWGKANGFARFDFGGAGKPTVPYGVREYKKKFGGQIVNFGRYEKSDYPALYKTATFTFKLMQKKLKKIALINQ